MSDIEFDDNELFLEEPSCSNAPAAGRLRHVDERLFFQTRVEVAMKAHRLSADEAVDYVFTRINGAGIGCIDDDGKVTKGQATARRR